MNKANIYFQKTFEKAIEKFNFDNKFMTKHQQLYNALLSDKDLKNFIVFNVITEIQDENITFQFADLTSKEVTYCDLSNTSNTEKAIFIHLIYLNAIYLLSDNAFGDLNIDLDSEDVYHHYLSNQCRYYIDFSNHTMYMEEGGSDNISTMEERFDIHLPSGRLIIANDLRPTIPDIEVHSNRYARKYLGKMCFDVNLSLDGTHYAHCLHDKGVIFSFCGNNSPSYYRNEHSTSLSLKSQAHINDDNIFEGNIITDVWAVSIMSYETFVNYHPKEDVDTLLEKYNAKVVKLKKGVYTYINHYNSEDTTLYGQLKEKAH